MSGPSIGVVLPAAGLGRRMGGVRKPMLLLGGRPILEWALDPFLARADVTACVVALPPEFAIEPPPWLRALDGRVHCVAGGATRADSVARGLEALPVDVDLIAVHDAARPLVSADLVEACVRVAAGGEGAVAGVPAVDTVKEVDAERRVVGTPERARLWYAHTPQIFPAAILREAYRARDRRTPTDDASLVEAVGGVVRMVESPGPNPKVTRLDDLRVAEALIAEGPYASATATSGREGNAS